MRPLRLIFLLALSLALDVAAVAAASVLLSGCDNEGWIRCPSTPTCAQAKPGTDLYQPGWRCWCVRPGEAPHGR